MEKKEIKRIEYLDLLRIISVFFVIIIHAPAPGQYWFTLDVDGVLWRILNFYDSISRWSVPMFVMISGALILSKEYSIKKIYKKILKLIIAFLCWALIYAIAFDKNSNAIIFIKSILTGYYHMWFLIMIIGLYMLVPILKKITESEQLTKYFLIVSFTLTTILPQIANHLALIDNNYTDAISKAIISNLGNFKLFLGYTGYFVLGYYLKNTEITKKWRYIIYGLGIIGYLETILLTNLVSNISGKATETYYEFFALNVALEALGIFVFAKYHFKTNKVLQYLSTLCLGIYLSHFVILYKLDSIWNINIMSFNPIISVPSISALVFAISLLVSVIISKIPILKKYII